MKNFLRCKSVGGGLMELLNKYCQEEQLKSPIHKTYQIDERVSFGYWLKSISMIHEQRPLVGLGVEIGKYVQPAHVGVLAYLSQSCENLAQFFELSARYVSIWYNFTPLNIARVDDAMLISWEQPVYSQAGIYEVETAISQELMVSMLWHRLKQLIDPSQVRFNYVELTTAKPDHSKIYQLFECPVRFSSEKTCISLPIDLLYIPLSKPDPVLNQILQQQADISLENLPADNNFIERVNAVILESLKIQRAFADHVANELNMSARQLQKLLKDQDMSFQHCLNNMRLKLAQQYLKDPEISIIDVAVMLSYAEPASFNRAFKTWTGQSPSQWRAEHVQAEAIA